MYMKRAFLVFVILALVLLGRAQVQADFSASVTAGCSPIVVNFQDQSAGPIVAWEWDLGNGTSTLTNPGVLYTTPGSYTIRLIVTGAGGQQDTATKVGFIQVYGYPQAQFTAGATRVCTFEPIQFTDQSTPGSGNLTYWKWDFGDGTISNQQHPTHSYPSPGVYQVSLVVRNQHQCGDDLILSNYITVSAPDADFTADPKLACGPPLTVNFTSQTSSGQHQWDFGNGHTSNQVDPSHAYQHFGSFTVRHIVADSLGCRDTVTKPQLINIGVNTLSIEADDSTLCEGDSIYFTTNAAANSTVVWDFGNGDSAAGHHPGYRYLTPGNYTATAHISDVSGCSVTLTLPIAVYDRPEVDFGVADTNIGCAVPFAVDFVDQSVGALRWEWRFGDGQTDTLQHPTHLYQAVDTFRVQLLAWGPGGCRAVRTKTNYIRIQEVAAGFSATPREGCVPLPVSFTDTTSSPFPVVAWEWDFGDGSTSTQQHPQHTYTQPGGYDVRLISENSQGCRDTAFFPAYVQAGNQPTVNFMADTNQACALSEIHFTNLSSGATDFIWYFGDGDTAMSMHASHGFAALGDLDVMLVGSDRGCRDTLLRNDYVHILAPLPIIGISEKRICELPRDVIFQNLSLQADTWSWLVNGTVPYTANGFTHTFTTPGTHHVTLTVSNHSTGCVVQAQDTLRILPLEADFVADTTRGCAPLDVQFTDQSLNANDWKWYFGTSDSSDLPSPRYRYRHVGDYAATLVVRNALNCRDTLTLDPIRALGVNADFTADQPHGCVPLVVNFQDSSYGTGPIAQWYWDFGDTTSSIQPSPAHVYGYQSYHDVKLRVVDADGCTDSITKRNFVHATQPIPEALITPPVNCADKQTTFVSLSSGVGLSYLWDFGDGQSSNQANITHAYADTGVYDIGLTVTDVNGCDSSVFLPQAVTIRELLARFTADTTYAPCPPLNVSFLADTAFPHQEIEWFWDFGDGAVSTQPAPQHNYTLPGRYDVTLIVSTPTGCSDTLVMEDLIRIDGPTGQFSFDPYQGCPGLEVTFTANSSDSVSYEWVFGDGSTGLGRNTSHVYTEPGHYTPVLVVQDSSGCRVFHVSPDQVRIYTPPTTALEATPQVLCEAGTVQFTDQSTAPGGVYHWWWDFGDGQSDSSQHPVHHYDTLGYYDVQLITAGRAGCYDTLYLPDYIRVEPNPAPRVLASDTSGCVPFAPQLSVQAPGHVAALHQWAWQLGDGSSSQDSSPQPTYATAGSYLAYVVVTDTNGCRGHAELSLRAHALPQVDFVASDSFGCAPFPVQFADRSGPGIVAWQWALGTGDTSQQAAPAYTYQADGRYRVSLTVTDSNGCVSTLTKDPYLHLSHPQAAFEPSEQRICPGSVVAFTDQSQSDTTLAQWWWTLGNGDSSRAQHPTQLYSEAGLYGVQLWVEDVFGCRDSINRPGLIEVLRDEVPQAVALQRVSVQSPQAVLVEFDKYPNLIGDFGAYLIYRANAAGQYVPVGRVTALDQTTFRDAVSSTETAPLCYKVQVENHCGTTHSLDSVEAHCTVEVATADGIEEVEVAWHPYVGWPVESYQLFRVDGYDEASMTLLATLPGGDTSYLDLDMFCYDTYQYRVRALGGRGRSALSDVAFAAPTHLPPDQPNHVVNVTVEDNAYLSVEWERPAVEDAVAFVLKRKPLGGTRNFQEVHRQPVAWPDLKYQDHDVAVDAGAYLYRAFTADTCGDYTPLGRSGSSIHLTATQENGDIILRWNGYEGWAQGVAYQVVEVYDQHAGLYREVAELPGDQQQFIHQEVIDQPNSCYRVTAYEAQGHGSTSLSNEACIVPGPMWANGNAFTPNGDGINDEFRFVGRFMSTFEVSIYNRWGKLVFQANQMDTPWDGTDLSGYSLPEGVYVWVASGQAYSGVHLQRKGSISLIR